MNLVEAEAVGPVEGDAPLVTPPRPPHRRVSVSLVFTMTVLIGTVVAIYVTLPARSDVLVTEAIAHYQETPPVWDVRNPSPAELRRWVVDLVGQDPPLPAASIPIIGARRITVLNRAAALIGVHVGDEDITYLIQRTPVISPEHTERYEGKLRAIAWRSPPYTCVVVGPSVSWAAWHVAFP